MAAMLWRTGRSARPAPIGVSPGCLVNCAPTCQPTPSTTLSSCCRRVTRRATTPPPWLGAAGCRPPRSRRGSASPVPAPSGTPIGRADQSTGALARRLEGALLAFDGARAGATLGEAFGLYPVEQVCLEVV